MKRLVTPRGSFVVCMVACSLFLGWCTSNIQAEEINLAWDPNSGTVGGYKLHYGTSSRAYTTIVDVGNTTSHTLNLDLTHQHYFIAVTAYDPPRLLESGYSNEVTTAPQMVPDKSGLFFNGTSNRAFVSDPQTVRVSITGFGTASWTAQSNRSYLRVSPTSGSGDGTLTVSVDRASMPLNAWSGAITLSSADAYNSPQSISVSGNVYSSTSAPFGSFDTPGNGASNIAGNIAVTGWVLDDIEATSVRIWRAPVSGEGSSLIFVGDAVFVEGSRPDVEIANPSSPFNYRAGWGYMMLTNFLPNQGNGTYTFYAIAEDREGHQTTLGTKIISCNNASATLPFGTIDTPTQGGTVSGNYRNFGWALAQPGNRIPSNGSTMSVWVDSIRVGNVGAGAARGDITSLFPGYDTSSAVHYLDLNTTTFENGVHTIHWIVTDDHGFADGVGSRFFVIENTGTADLTPMVELDEKVLRFGAVEDGSAVTPAIELPFGVTKAYSWTADVDRGFVRLRPRNGSVDTKLEVAATSRNLVAGDYIDTITISLDGQADSFQQIQAHLRVYETDTTEGPFGSLDTPPDGAVGVQDLLAVTGWALDDIATTKVEIWRDPVGGEETSENGFVFLGEAEFARGARPDVARRYGGYPLSSRAGWSYELDTRRLPHGGNGTYRLRAIAHDEEGHQKEIGAATVVCTNPS